MSVSDAAAATAAAVADESSVAAYQIADIFTKVLPRPAHEFLRSKIGVMSPTEFHSWRASDHKP